MGAGTKRMFKTQLKCQRICEVLFFFLQLKFIVEWHDTEYGTLGNSRFKTVFKQEIENSWDIYFE